MRAFKTLLFTAVALASAIGLVSCPSPGPSPAPKHPEIVVRQDARLLATGDAILCGSTVVGTPKDVVITIENTGSGELLLPGSPIVILSGTDVTSYSIPTPPAASVTAGANTTFTLRFDPSTVGDKSATAGFSCNDGDEESYTFAIQGTATAVPEPEMNIRGPGGNPIVDGGSYSFASTVIDSTTDAVFTIENLGSADLTLGGTPMVVVGGADAGMFSVTAQPASPVAASGGTTFTVRFSPTGVGAKSATLSIACNDTDENPYDLTLGGTCTGVPEINVKQASTDIPDGTGAYAFADTMLGTTTEATFTIENVGSSALSLTSSVTIGGTHAPQFTVTAQPSSPVPAGGTATFTIRFTPTSTGVKSATLSFGNTDADENPYNFSLSGNGTAWHGVRTIDSVGSEGYTSSICISGGLEISYFDGANGDLKWARSINGGASWTVRTVDSAGTVGLYSSVASTGGSEFIAYYDSTNGDLKFAKSTDGGVTWPVIKAVDSTGDVGQYCSIVQYGGTRVWISYLDNTNHALKLARSTDGGSTFILGTLDSAGPGLYTSLKNSGASLLYLGYCWQNGTLRFTKSSDGGASWPAGGFISVDTGTSGLGAYASVACDGSNIYLGYEGASSVMMAKSADGGATWPVSHLFVNSAGVYGAQSSLGCVGSTVYICYRGSGLQLAVSADGGATWPVGAKKSVDAGCTPWGTSLAAAANSVFISYYDTTSHELRFAKSIDGGTTW